MTTRIRATSTRGACGARGWVVDECTGGEDALLAAADVAPDVIVMAFRLPGIDGAEATRLLKADEWTKDIPVVLCAPPDGAHAEAAARAAGCEVFLAKPWRPDHLRWLLEHLISVDDPTDD